MWPLLGAASGLIAGSFLATLVLRWPEGRTLAGRSHCDGCSTTLPARDLVPLLSFALARGRCRQCGAAIDWRHPAIELSAAIIGALAMLALPGWPGFAGALFGWMLLALLALDVEHFWLPDLLTLPLLALGLLLGIGGIEDRMIGAVAGGGALLLVAFLYRTLRKRDGLGLGDVKLMAALGAWIGPAALPLLLLGAASLGLLLVLLHRLQGMTVTELTRLPFGACLAAIAFPLWLWLAATG